MPLIKHAPHKHTGQNTIYISSRTPLISGVKRVSKLLKNKTVAQVKVGATGKAIQKVLCLALELKKQGYVVDIYTRTIKVLDELVDDQGAQTSQRLVGAVELKVSKPREIEVEISLDP